MQALASLFTCGQPKGSPPRIQKQPRLRLFFGVPGGSRKERRDAIAKRRCLHRKRSVSREGSTAEQWALKNARDSPENKTKQPRLRLFFGVPGGSRKERRDAIAKRRCLHRKRSVSREGSTAEQWALKNARDSPENKTKQPRLQLFFGVPGGSRKEQSDEIA